MDCQSSYLETNFNDEKQIHHCIYENQNYQIEFEYRINEHQWNLISMDKNLLLIKEFSFENEIHSIFNQLNPNHSFDQQLTNLIQQFDQLFSKLNPIKKSSLTIEDNPCDHLKLANFDQTLLNDKDLNSHRSRTQSSSSTMSSIRYTSFYSGSIETKLSRQIIKSIILNVQEKKTFFDRMKKKFQFRSSIMILNDLGREFLRVYDGKFNYQRGHTFFFPFQNQIWFLTIEKLQYIQCQLGREEPKSNLILHYKDFFYPVQI